MTVQSIVCLTTAATILSVQGFAPATMGSSFVQTRSYHMMQRPTVAIRPTTSSALQMNLFDRFQRVAKSNINNVLKNLEDPEKILNQALEDMQVCSCYV